MNHYKLQIRFSFIHPYGYITLQLFLKDLLQTFGNVVSTTCSILLCLTDRKKLRLDVQENCILTEHRVPSRGAAELLKALRESFAFGHPLQNRLKLLLSQTRCFNGFCTYM